MTGFEPEKTILAVKAIRMVRTSSIGGYGTVHLLSSEFVDESVIEADQSAW